MTRSQAVLRDLAGCYEPSTAAAIGRRCVERGQITNYARAHQLLSELGKRGLAQSISGPKPVKWVITAAGRAHINTER